ncbi:MAG: TRAP transporter fused permease subunit [Planctomycetota bacterium]|jgi:TRAP transporter 4TM/12TM fusion protein|nr:TRAP transporter fused permease subunit [Planctomycetota bacterium]
MDLFAKARGAIKEAGVRQSLIVVATIVFVLFQSYLAFIRPLHPLLQTPLHWVIALIVAFLIHPIYKRPEGAPESWKDKLFIIDLGLFAALIYCAIYFISQSNRLTHRVAYLDPLLPIDYITAVIAVIIILEAVRRVLGWNLVVFVAIFMAYFWLGPYLPNLLRHRGTTIARFTDLMVMGTDGIFGLTVAVSVSFIYHFVIFGSLFADMGGGNVLTDIGFSVSKGTAGGPAKAAVIASGLLGMVSGSATANVTTTGVITIPMMKKQGYPAHEAGAIEAVASTGGQIMPPIMGASAFLMAEIVGISYLSICVSAIIPALCYYFSVFVLVTFLAKRHRARQSMAAVIKTPPILPRLFLLIPMLVLIYCVLTGLSLQRSAIWGVFAVIAFNFLRGGKRVRFGQIMESLVQATKNVANVVIPTSACGIVIGSITASGLANRISTILESVGGTSLFYALVIAMLGCMVLGMALPTLAAYIIANILFATPLVRLGMTPLTANLFLFYFGIFAQITPPVCLASFAAAGIAGANSWKTGWTAFFFALVSFLVPYVFAYHPEVLLGVTADYHYTGYLIITLLCGSVIACAAIAGWIYVPLNAFERVLMAAAAVAIIVPETLSTVLGLIAGAVFFAICHMRKKRRMAGELEIGQ